MWDKVINIDELLNANRWTVEFFVTSNKKMQSKYTMVKLNDLVNERKDNVKPQSYPEKLFNYIGLENVASLTGELINFSPKKGKEIKSTSRNFYSGDILYGRLRPYLNKVYLAENEVTEGICSGEFHVLSIDCNKVLPFYLRTILASEYIQNYVKSMQAGSALPRLGIDDLLNIQIPIPPIQVQKEIEDYIVEKEARIKCIRRELEILPLQMIETVVKYVK